MDAIAPITIDGKVFSAWNVHLAVSQTVQGDGSQPISIALRCVPARATGNDGEGPATEIAESAAMSIYRGKAEDILDADELSAYETIRAALVTLLRAKGL